jgi:predicted nuclease with TOPRIM domain
VAWLVEFGGPSLLQLSMTETENLVLEHLRHIRSAVDVLRDDMREVKGRLGILESQYANLSNRLDRLDARVERIEARLNLAEV